MCEVLTVMWTSHLQSGACVAQPIPQILDYCYIERSAGKNYSYWVIHILVHMYIVCTYVYTTLLTMCEHSRNSSSS